MLWFLPQRSMHVFRAAIPFVCDAWRSCMFRVKGFAFYQFRKEHLSISPDCIGQQGNFIYLLICDVNVIAAQFN
jgi:hypothetical protein